MKFNDWWFLLVKMLVRQLLLILDMHPSLLSMDTLFSKYMEWGQNGEEWYGANGEGGFM